MSDTHNTEQTATQTLVTPDAAAPTAQPQETIELGAGTFLLGPANLVDLRAIRLLLEKPKQFIVVVGENQIAQCDLYDEEIRMMKGIMARLVQLQINVPQEGQ